MTLENNFTQDDITDYLDSNKTNVCLVASLDAFLDSRFASTWPQLAAVIHLL
ncbi:hypothetical protein [Paraflavitalea speifideaquila]|uniref:hypothetical protein n=1 Tax=Paraflavitalea speifideaquila TaxID=3076558 RepID=UPI0028EAFD41|nr:hypothetical protein [Paraflavitalea speifideiaquila]